MASLGTVVVAHPIGKLRIHGELVGSGSVCVERAGGFEAIGAAGLEWTGKRGRLDVEDANVRVVRRTELLAVDISGKVEEVIRQRKAAGGRAQRIMA